MLLLLIITVFFTWLSFQVKGLKEKHDELLKVSDEELFQDRFEEFDWLRMSVQTVSSLTNELNSFDFLESNTISKVINRQLDGANALLRWYSMIGI